MGLVSRDHALDEGFGPAALGTTMAATSSALGTKQILSPFACKAHAPFFGVVSQEQGTFYFNLTLSVLWPVLTFLIC